MLEPDEQQVKRYGRAASSKKSTFHVSSAALNSAKGADLRHQAAKELASSLGGALDTATVLRGFLEGAKGADVRHQAAKELASSFGALDTATVLRGFLEGVSILSWHTQ